MPKRVSETKKTLIIHAYKCGLRYRDIIAIFHVKSSTITRIFHAANIQSRPKQPPFKIANEQEDAIIQKYNSGMSLNDIGQIYKVSCQPIRRILKKRRIEKHPRYRLAVREDSFDQINEASAYWVGFLMADGCIHSPKGSSPWIYLRLASKDVTHIEKFRHFLEAEQKITFIKPEQNHGFPAAQIVIRSQRLVDALLKLGIKFRKTFEPIDSPLITNRHFWRGMVDGDGCLGNYETGSIIELAGNQSVIQSFADYLGSIFPNIRKKMIAQGKIFRMRFHGKIARIIIDHLYNDATIYLDRKYLQAQIILSNTAATK